MSPVASSRLPPECSTCHPLAEALQRHSPQHSCPFCDKTFARVDNARRHAKTCPHRGSRPLPPEAKRGRKLRACDQCSRVKASCDGKAPCARCSSRLQDCTFNWICRDASDRRQFVTRMRTSEAMHLPLAFLVNFTDPNRDFITEEQVAKEPENNIPDTSGQKTTPPPDLKTPDCIDPTLLFGDPYLYSSLDEDGNYANAGQDVLFLFPPPNDRLAMRLSILAAELQEFALTRPKFRDSFDLASFNDLFSSSNVHNFVMTYSRKRHYQAPIIHWPTFDLEEAPLPLLLAVAVTGAAYSYCPSYHPDFAFRAREFYWISDAYIFKHLKRCIETFTPSSSASIESLELCQAGLLSFCMDACMNDDEMRRNAVTKRLPTLVAALRTFRLIGTRHETSEDWGTFVRKETHVRLTSWIFFIDAIITLFTNSPPRMTLSDMHGCLPCSAELWDAKSPAYFERRRADEEESGGFLCVQDLVSGLMAEEWAGVDSMPYSGLHFRNLHAIMCAFQPIIYNLHTSMLPSSNATVLLRALGRWDTLWDAAIRRFPDDQRKWMGLARNAPEVGWLSRKILEINQTEAGKKLVYFQRVPGYNAEDVHDFIRELRSNST